MTEFAIHTKDSAPEASKELLAAAQAEFGFVPNLLGEMAHAPSLLKAYWAVREALDTVIDPVHDKLLPRDSPADDEAPNRARFRCLT